MLNMASTWVSASRGEENSSKEFSWDLQTSLQHVVHSVELGHSWLEGSGRECSPQHKGGCMSIQNLEPQEKTIRG